MKRIDELPAIITSFAYRQEYFPELEGMVASVREYHPHWWMITGKGPLANYDRPALEVESPAGKFQWQLPVSFELDGSENDWLRIVLMKGWWVAQVWQNFGAIPDSEQRRLIWLDADARFNGPLDIVLDPLTETVAGPWGVNPQRVDPANPEESEYLCSGLAVFQGKSGGIVEEMLKQWSADCLVSIVSPPVASIYESGPEGDQDLLTKILKGWSKSAQPYQLIKLDVDKYCGVPNYKDGTPPDALVSQWMMNEKMRLPQDRDKNWPPPESVRKSQHQVSKLISSTEG